MVADSGQAKQALALVKAHKPALVMMDFDTLQGIHLDILARIRTGFPAVKVIIYFAHVQADAAFKVIRAGASGFVLKSAGAEEMENAIRTVLKGGVHLSPEFLHSVGKGEGIMDAQGKALSARQAQVLRLLAQGLSTRALAVELQISAKTVDVHKQALVKRLGLKNSAELPSYSIRAGLLTH